MLSPSATVAVVMALQAALHGFLFWPHLAKHLRKGWCQRRTVNPELLRYVEIHFQACRSRNLRSLLHNTIHVVCIFHLAAGAYAALTPEWSVGFEMAFRNLGTWAVMAALVLLLRLVTSERLLGQLDGTLQVDWPRRLMDAHFSLAMLFFALQGVVTPLPHSLRPALNLCRIGLSQSNADVWHGTAWGAIVLVTYLASLFSRDALALEAAVSEGCVFLGIILMTWTHSNALWQASVAAIDSKASRRERGALTEILNATCDAVVQLDARLCVRKQSAALSALLLSAAQPQAGTPFASLLASDEDRRLFHSAMESPSERLVGDVSPPAQAFQVSLQDAIGNRIRVQIFHARFEMLDADTRYVIGLSECGDAVSKAIVEGARATARAAVLQDAFREDPDTMPLSDGPCGPLGAGKPRRGRSQRSLERRGTRLERIPALGCARVEPRVVCVADGDGEGSATSSSLEGSTSDSATWAWTHGGPDVGELLKPTEYTTKETMIIKTALLWNFSVPRRCCCYYHQVAQECRTICQHMAKQACRPEKPLALRRQCAACGVMLPAGAPLSECIFCDRSEPGGERLQL